MKSILRGSIVLLLVSITSLVYADTKVYFSPNGGCQGIVVSEIGKAQKSIDIAMYSFTSREIAQALLRAKDKGVKIRIVLDKDQIKEEHSKSRYLIKKGVDVKFHLGLGLMHDKFAVVDEKTVLTGSFNWTISADRKNAENLLVIKDKELAEKYIKQFKLLWSKSGEGGFGENYQKPS